MLQHKLFNKKITERSLFTMKCSITITQNIDITLLMHGKFSYFFFNHQFIYTTKFIKMCGIPFLAKLRQIKQVGIILTVKYYLL